MASPRRDPRLRRPAPDAGVAPTLAGAKPADERYPAPDAGVAPTLAGAKPADERYPAPEVLGAERVAITLKPERTNKVDKPAEPQGGVRDRAHKLEQAAGGHKPPPRTSSIDASKAKVDEQSYVKNSSFLSRDIQAQKTKVEPTTNFKIKPESQVVKEAPQEPGANSPPRKSILSPPPKQNLPLRNDVLSPTKTEVCSPPKMKTVSPPKKESNSPPVATFKAKKIDENPPAPKSIIKEASLAKEPPTPLKAEKLSLADNGVTIDREVKKNEANNAGEVAGGDVAVGNEESNGVGDKIKKFEKAAEDASVPGAGGGRLSRPGSVRARAQGQAQAERRPSEEDLPPPATPFKDNVHFDLGTVARQQSVSKSSPPLPKWPRETQPAEVVKKAEPQRIVKPEFKPMPSPVDVTIRSPSLGVKIQDQFPSHGTAFRNVASPAPVSAPASEADVARAVLKFNQEANDLNNFKACKAKPKEKYQVSKGSSYFTRGSEEIWLVKKKDIEEIEERVLDSFRRAGGNVCARGDSLRPASDGGHAHAAFSHATMGRKRQMYARSESLDPQWAGARAHTLKRQTSVACTCGHDKKTRAKSAGPEPASAPVPAPATAQPPRPRSRSHGDDHQQQVLDKYETLV